MKRYLTPYILADLQKKMVFLGGPRQVGKTTLAKNIASTYEKSTYLNWDIRTDAEKIRLGQHESESQLVIFDEIHKYPNWKNHLK
jgi:uncharacterized protein